MGDSKEFDELELRNRTITETLSPLENLGQDKKETKVTANRDEKKGKEYDTLPIRNKVKHDILALRNRDITETLTSIPAEVHDTLQLRNRIIEETLTKIDIDVACDTNPAEI